MMSSFKKKCDDSARALQKTGNLIMALLDSQKNPEFCDIKIKTNDGEIAASKFILSIRSEYFRVMFSNNFVESSSGTVKMPYPRAVVDKVIRYLYTGQMEFKDPNLERLLDVLDLLRMMNLSEEFKQLERYTSDLIYKGKFRLSSCLRNLDKSSKMRMEQVGETLINYLRWIGNLNELCQMPEVCVLSEAMIIMLLQKKDDPDDHEEEVVDEDSDDDEKEEEQKEKRRRRQTILRFKIFTKWLSTNPMATDKKAKAFEMFNLDHFTVNDLLSMRVRDSDLRSDKIIVKIEQLLEGQEKILDDKQRDLKKKKRQLEEIKLKEREALSGKDQDSNKPMKEKKSEEEEDLKRKRKLEDPTSEGKISKL